MDNKLEKKKVFRSTNCKNVINHNERGALTLVNNKNLQVLKVKRSINIPSQLFFSFLFWHNDLKFIRCKFILAKYK